MTVAPPRPWHNGSPDKAKAKKLAQKESTKESAKEESALVVAAGASHEA